MFAVSGKRATEAHYPAGYSWGAQGRLLPGALLVGGRTIPIVSGAFAAYVDLARSKAGQAVVGGWAGDVRRGRPADSILVFAGDRLVASSPPTVARPDVARSVHKPGLTRVGYSISFSSSELSNGIRVFAVSGNHATEARYPKGYPWSPK